jgi:hypothetical protein
MQNDDVIIIILGRCFMLGSCVHGPCVTMLAMWDKTEWSIARSKSCTAFARLVLNEVNM